MRHLPSWRASTSRLSIQTQPILHARRPLTTRTRTAIHEIPTCPPATCSCFPTPQGLDIKRDGPMSMPFYTAHIVVRTGRRDWPSRIEDDQGHMEYNDGRLQENGVNIAKTLKSMLGPGGKYHMPEKNYIITYSERKDYEPTTIYVWPRNIIVRAVPNTHAGIERFISKVLFNEAERRTIETREDVVARTQEHHQSELLEVAEVNSGVASEPEKTKDRVPARKDMYYFPNKKPVILICGHDARDSRCGVMGPILDQQFMMYVKDKYSTEFKGPEVKVSMSMRWQNDGFVRSRQLHLATSEVISHVGGHAWAGNVIIYVPHSHKTSAGRKHPLAGKGVWYGRVEPWHVEGIMEETVKKGVIIEEILRGIWEAPAHNRVAQDNGEAAPNKKVAFNQRNRRA